MQELMTQANAANTFFSTKDAAVFATEYIRKNVTSSNISYLIQYGKVKKYERDGATVIKMSDLISYYESFNGKRFKKVS